MRDTRCTTLGSVIVLIRGGAGPGGVCTPLLGFEADRRGHDASGSPLGLSIWVSVGDLISSACCLTASWSDSSSSACFCEAASSKLVVASIE